MARFDRKPARFKQQPTVLVICEDTKSSKCYLEDASLHFRVKVQVEIVHCGKTDPKGIVEAAINRQKNFDEVFCVIDRDTHKNFAEALNLAKTANKIEIITSYPCFEFWLLLHFGYNRKPYSQTSKHSAADLVIKDLRAQPLLKDYDKGSVKNLFNVMLNNGFTEARRVAPKVLAEAENTGEMNPSTQLHILLNRFDSLSKPQEIQPIS